VGKEMKKMIKVLILIFALTFFTFVTHNVAFAEEVTEGEEIVENEPTEDVATEEVPTVEDIPTEEPVVDEPVDDNVTEEVSFRDMIKDFIDKWLMAILATFGGGAGTAVALYIAKSFLKSLREEVKASAENNKESNATLAKAQETIADGLDNITNRIEKFEKTYSNKIEGTLDTVNECIGEIGALRTDNAKFKELIALLVTSTPQLASNGYATKILELLNEGSETNE
jgi:gas vesicle protein